MVLTQNHHTDWTALVLHCFPLLLRPENKVVSLSLDEWKRRRLPDCETCFVSPRLDPRLPSPFPPAAHLCYWPRLLFSTLVPSVGWKMSVRGHRHRRLNSTTRCQWLKNYEQETQETSVMVTYVPSYPQEHLRYVVRAQALSL